MSVKVTLTDGELAMAKAVGRRMNGSSKKRKDAHGHDPNDPRWVTAPGDELHIVGACGEAAVAKLLNRFWWSPDFRDRGLGDIGPGIHVRSTTVQTHRLIVHETDAPDRPDDIFILAIRDSSLGGKRLNARWDIVGFIRAEDAKKPMWWGDPNTGRPAFFVGQGGLTPIEVLLEGWVR